MTALCLGGTSSVKEGSPGLASIGTAVIADVLVKAGLAGFAIAAVVEAFLYDVEANCTSDPPALPTWDASDAASFALGTLAPNWVATAQKINDLLYNWAWHQYCQCDGGVEQPTLVYPKPPTGLGSQSPNNPTPCWRSSWAGVPPVLNGIGSVDQLIDVGAQLVPVRDSTVETRPWSGLLLPARPVRTPIIQARWTQQVAHAVDPGVGVQPGVEFFGWDDTDALVLQFSLTPFDDREPSQPTYMVDTSPTWMSAMAWYDATATPGGIQPGRATSISLEWFCRTAFDTSDNCCPPDPSIVLALNNILSIVTRMEQELEQLRTKPYVDGPRHSNLTGNGSIAIDPKSVAIRVEIKSDLTNWPRHPQIPTYYYSVGFITPFAVGTPLKGARLVYQNQIYTWPSYTDRIAYSLEGGVIVDLVELSKAP